MKKSYLTISHLFSIDLDRNLSSEFDLFYKLSSRISKCIKTKKNWASYYVPVIVIVLNILNQSINQSISINQATFLPLSLFLTLCSPFILVLNPFILEPQHPLLLTIKWFLHILKHNVVFLFPIFA